MSGLYLIHKIEWGGERRGFHAHTHGSLGNVKTNGKRKKKKIKEKKEKKSTNIKSIGDRRKKK